MMTLVENLADYMDMAASSDPDDKAASGPVSSSATSCNAILIRCTLIAREEGHGKAIS